MALTIEQRRAILKLAFLDAKAEREKAAASEPAPAPATKTLVQLQAEYPEKAGLRAPAARERALRK